MTAPTASSEVSGDVGRAVPRLRHDASRLWTLTVILAAGAVWMQVGLVARLAPPAAPVSVPWWVLAVVFALTEVCVVHLHFRRDSQSVSLSEIPLVVGLCCMAPTHLVLAQVLGAGTALMLYRRQPSLKLIFNVSNLALYAGLATVVFHAVLGGRQVTGPVSWAAALAAATAANLLQAAVIQAAIALSEGSLQLERIPGVVLPILAATLCNTCVGIATVMVLSSDPRGLWVLVVPVAIVFVSYRSYAGQRKQHESMEFLYEASWILQRRPEMESAVLALLSHARTMFRAELGELVLLPQGDDESAVRTVVGPGEHTELMRPLDPAAVARLSGMVAGETRALLMTPEGEAAVWDGYLGSRGIRDAMVVSVQGEGGVAGVLVMGNRLGELSAFGVDDLKLFETFATHTGIAVENGRLERRLKERAFYDPLTKLANRALFSDRLEHALDRRRDDGTTVAVLFVDLDEFKLINDSLGHATGDRLLNAVGTRLRECLRAFDTAARLGGDEFAILLEDVHQLADATTVADRVVTALRKPFTIGGSEVITAASVGVVLATPGKSGADDLLINADVAMYDAKRRGKGRYEIFQPDMQVAVLERHALKADLQRALENGELFLEYQPVVALRTGRALGVEALLRWRHPVRGLVPPTVCVPLAEENGLIAPIGRFVLEQACRQATLWEERFNGDLPLTVSVNVSARQLQQAGFVDDVARILCESRVDPRRLTLEITESVMVENASETVEQLTQLKRLGVSIAIDDFGTGYSSLSSLQELPIDILKIAKPFVDRLADGAEAGAFAHAIVRLGQTLDLHTVAEGIETAEQRLRLAELGCEMGQGYHFAPPLSVGAMDEYLRAQAAAAPAPNLRVVSSGTAAG